MRPCWYLKDSWKKGIFHSWSITFEELNNGIGHYPIAIVEDLNTHEIEEVILKHLRFVDPNI
jgi:hypothetical protein